MSKKIVLVSGATGNQGSALVRALLQHGGYHIRALTRDTQSDAATSLAEKGVDVVPGQLSDKDSLLKACQGVYAAFGVSIPSTGPGIADEKVQGRNLVDACKANNVELLVWSSVPGCKDTSHGRFAVPVFDDKAEVEKYIKIVDQPAIVIHLGAFTGILLTMGALKRDNHDHSKFHAVIPFVAPDSRQPYTYVEEDLGPAVVALINKWEDATWRRELSKSPIPLVSYDATGREVADTLAKGDRKGR
ncbi:NADP-binding protein [Dacryopinax primogenitus]|uniref:NADP-binding protein n=1 Tax=Dacryopinax primogenitus (strain DJM 731) TaxID=1858805 RepID=M5GBJ5_DACPD|nr:NADP-binding protein [Dacryopinax primogenitus]EJU01378.1 NADP-binding protein [Dacryopinax primogenitus]